MPKLKTTIPIDDWNIIVKKIHARKCVPFLGAGVNFKCGEEDSLPLGADVALRLLERMIKRQEHLADASYRINWKNLQDYRKEARAALAILATPGLGALDPEALEGLVQSVLKILPDDEAKLAHIIVDDSLDQYQDLTRVALQDLARVSLRYRRNKNLPDFVDELKEIIPDTQRNAPRLLRVLANMPFRLIVTTNYDRLMERALELFEETAVKQPNLLSSRIKTDQSDFGDAIRGALSQEMFDLVEAFETNDEATHIPAALWLKELNDLIQQNSLYLLEEGKGETPEVYERPETIQGVRRNRQLLERSYPEALQPNDKTYEAIVQPINGFQGADQVRIRNTLAAHEGVVLYKLHGTFTDDAAVEETRPVITEEDYIEFLTYVGGQGENIDSQITSTIKTSMLLFLGYSLEDWNFRALFKGLIEKVDLSNRPFSYAIQKNPSEFWVRFWEGSNRNVHIFNVDICEFTEELESRYAAYVSQVEQVEDVAKRIASEREAKRKERRARSGRL